MGSSQSSTTLFESMKITKREISAKDAEGSITVIPEVNEDLWHLYHIISPGDHVRATTIRKISKESSSGTVNNERVKITLTIQLDKIDFDANAGQMRLSGQNISENKWVKLGAYHTIEVEVNRKLSISKPVWDGIFLKRLEDATDLGKSADVAAIVLTEGKAHLCLLTQHMTIEKQKFEKSIPKKRYAESHEKELNKFFESIVQGILRHIDFNVIKCVLVASPGFTKDQFYKYMLQVAQTKDIKTLLSSKDKFLLVHSNSAHLHALKEVLRDEGVMKQLQDNGFVFEGFNCVFSSNIPVGSGLSSSAALECGMIFGIKELFNLKIEKKDIALLGQKAEHWVGINCGIMDQFSSVHGLENKVIQLDCNTLDFEYHNADFKDYSLVLFDSNVKHSLFTSEYNTRRMECEEGLIIIKNNFPDVVSFRDCSEEQLLKIQDQFTPVVFKRVHFVVKEIKRVIKACEALDNGNIKLLGQLLFETHYGLSQEYEVSCKELDMLVDTAKTDDFIIGSRLMGGGFGGCTINLIKKGYENEVKSKFSNLYLNTFGIQLKFYDVKIANGTTLL